jgi:heme A synthase
MTFTKKGVTVLIVSTLLCLLLEPIGYCRLYSGGTDIGWGGIVFSLVCIVIIICARSYFPKKPESLRKWLYLMATAFSLKILGELILKVYPNRSVALFFYGVGTLVFILSLSAAVGAYRGIIPASENEGQNQGRP